MNLVNAIRALSPTGLIGFEGLIVKLMGNLTGKRFFLARPGSQQGRDMRSDDSCATVIAIECKRYGQSKELDERELRAEIDEAATNIPALDLWVLVTSRRIPDQLNTLLAGKAKREGIDFLPVCFNDGSPSSLEVLCAQAPNIVIEHMQNAFTETSGILDDLERIRNISGFEERLRLLRKQFSDSWIGYSQWHSNQNSWLATCFKDESTSRAEFHQLLHVGSPRVCLIKRRVVWQAFDSWLADWHHEKLPFVLIGEEGDGKTWALASWINEKIATDRELPPIIFLSASQANCNNPLSLLSGAIARQLKMKNSDHLPKRLVRWMERDENKRPVAILVLDGINERWGHSWWRQLIEALATSPWKDQIALLVTARRVYWERNFSSLRHIQNKTFLLPPYDDHELDEALKKHNLSRNAVPADLLSLLSKPRYLDLTIKHLEFMMKGGDPTVARLIYEDWRDKWEKKSNLPIDVDSFQSLLISLAEKARNDKTRFSVSEITQELELVGEKSVAFDELITSGVFTGQCGHYKIDQKRLVLGFALLLCRCIQNAWEAGESLEETTAEWLEPYPEMDIKAAIIEMAALHSLTLDDFPDNGRVVLLQTWLGVKNPQSETEHSFAKYLPMRPESYLALAERIWSDCSDNPWGQQLIMRALLHWRSSQSLSAILPGVFSKWLGFIHVNGHPLQRRFANDGLEKTTALTEKIQSRLGRDHLQTGDLDFLGSTFTVIDDDGQMRLGRVALAIISHMPRKPFLDAIFRGMLAEAIMDFPDKYDMFAWVIRSSSQELWPDLLKKFHILSGTKNVICLQAAYRLLSIEGSERILTPQSTLPPNLFPPSPWFNSYSEDPNSLFNIWTRENYFAYLKKSDAPVALIAKKLRDLCLEPNLPMPDDIEFSLRGLEKVIQPEKVRSNRSMTLDDHNLRDIEPALCAYSPITITRIFRNIIRSLGERNQLSVRQLSFVLQEYEMIMTEDDRKQIFNQWISLIKNWETSDEVDREAEMFLFEVVLGGLDADQQLKALLRRPQGASDLCRYECKFKVPSNWEAVSTLFNDHDAVKVYRSLWFIATNPSYIPQIYLPKIMQLCSHRDSLVRANALKITYILGYKEAARFLIENAWSWDKDHTFLENHWGSLLLACHATDFSFEKLRCRIHPAYLGFAVDQRGCNYTDVEEYAKAIHYVLGQSSYPSLPNDFPLMDINSESKETEIPSLSRPRLSSEIWAKTIRFISREAFWGGIPSCSPKEHFEELMGPDQDGWHSTAQKIFEETISAQRKAGNIWFATEFYSYALDKVVLQNPDLVASWVGELADQRERIRLITNRSFYEALCEVLLKQNPELGVDLYDFLVNRTEGLRVVDSTTQIPLLRYSLFEAPWNRIIEERWKMHLDECKSDHDLLELTVLANKGDSREWLEKQIKIDLCSSAPFFKARATILWAFTGTDRAGEWLVQNSRPDLTYWLAKVINTAKHYYDVNVWAKHWFRRFIEINNDNLAWASFRLFLRCADRRFWGWCKQFVNFETDNPQERQRVTFFEANLEAIQRAVKENEGEMGKSFLVNKILKDEVAPWM